MFKWLTHSLFDGVNTYILITNIAYPAMESTLQIRRNFGSKLLCSDYILRINISPVYPMKRLVVTMDAFWIQKSIMFLNSNSNA